VPPRIPAGGKYSPGTALILQKLMEGVDVSTERKRQLDRQLESQLKPVLRPSDFLGFSLDKAFELVYSIAEAVL